MSVSYFAVFEAPASPASMWVDYAKMLLVLIGICLLALVVVKVLLPRLTGFAKPASNHIQVFARYPLEPRKTLYLVRTGKTVVLLAASAEAVHIMTTLNSEDFEDIIAPAQSDATSGSAFQRIVRTFADRKEVTSL
jgi:flagellar biogenesis protein FliO